MIFNLNKLWKTNRYASAKATLQLVVKELNHGDVASKELWDILTALRGPDQSGNEGLKLRTTARVRAAIGLKYQDYAHTDDGSIADMNGLDAERAGRHFCHHIVDAKSALETLGYIKSRDQELTDAIREVDKL